MSANEKNYRLVGAGMSRDFLTLWVGLALSTVCIAFFAMDVAGDLFFGNDFPGGKLHLGLEIFVVIISVSAFSFHILELVRLLRKHEKINAQVRIASGEFAGVIEELFVSWQLTPAERDVAMLLVKGLNFGGIAQARNAKEGTVKAQANSIYRKARVSSRHELVALFLDELLQDIEIGPAEG
jgi:DNA-binding CsgD family transcriptional regulator